MKFNTVTQTLLHENPKALQFLHYASGFDFNSPFHVSSGTGRFTFNKVMAQVSSVIKGPVNVALFVKVNNCYLPRLYYVPVGNSGFKPTKSGLRNTYYYNVNEFDTQRFFEEVRKNETDHYYIVIQSKSYSKPCKEKPFDHNARYEVLKTYPGSINGTYYIYDLDIIDKGTMPRYVSITPNKFLYPRELEAAGTDVHNYIDKSGYYISYFRHELHERLRDYKKNNARQLVLQSDFTATLHDLDSKTKEIKQALVAAADAMQTYEDCNKVERIAYNLRCMFHGANSIRRKIDEKAYWSLDSVQYDLEYFTTHYKDALKELGKGA